MADEKRIAVLIDADNAPASRIDVILNEVATFGAANVRRAYGNWKSPSLRPWEDNLHVRAIQPVQQFANTVGKNARQRAHHRRDGPALHPPVPRLLHRLVRQ